MLQLFITWVLRYAAHSSSRFGHRWYVTSENFVPMAPIQVHNRRQGKGFANFC